MRICALVVTFDPDLNVLERALSSLGFNVDKIFVFDNTDISSVVIKSEFHLNKPIEFISKSKNIGIAAAQNILLKAALDEGFDFSVMSDQDTIYPAGYVTDLVRFFLSRNDVAAVFPGWLDVNLMGEAKYPGQYVFDSNNRLKINRSESEVIEISHSISSGMIVNMHLLHQIGLMKEELFIDWVDNEWCWRARCSGFVLLADPTVKVRHTLGDCTVKIFGKNFVKRGVHRNYYIIRNALYLILYSSVPAAAKIYLAKKALHHTIFSLVASDDLFFEFRSLAKAWLHGLQARLGKIS